MTIILRHRRYTLEQHKLPKGVFGECDIDGRRLTIRPDLHGRPHLDTVLHEALHACLEDVSEESITETAESVTEFLWKLGYRRCEL